MVRRPSPDPLLNLDLPTKVAFLRRPENYPEHSSGVEAIETHMSWVFLTGDHVYKLKKPVRHSFVDFSSLAARLHYCQESIRLNRRLAKDVYLGVVPLTLERSGELHLDGAGQPVEWLVKMRRLPRDLMLDRAIEEDRVGADDIRRIVEVLAAFYRRAERVAMSSAQYHERLLKDVQTNRQALADPDYGLSRSLLARIHGKQIDLFEREPQLFSDRAAAGQIVEGHGDLRPEHVCLKPQPIVIDCLEFNRDFRILDPAHEMAYLAVECEYEGAEPIGEIVFDTYRKAMTDQPPPKLVDFYKSYRAALRARLSIWHVKDGDRQADGKWRARTERYLRLAEKYGERL